MTTEDDAYRHGMQARRDGKTIEDDCPYGADLPMTRLAWVDGWRKMDNIGPPVPTRRKRPPQISPTQRELESARRTLRWVLERQPEGGLAWAATAAAIDAVGRAIEVERTERGAGT